jgi:competence protein ComEC
LEVLHPPPPNGGREFSERNNNGLVLRLVYRDVSVLLTADIEAEAENYLVAQGRQMRSQVLKAAHHGSKTSTTGGFLERVDPWVAVISAGRDNPFGHPHPEVLARLEAAVGASQVYLTAECGSIELISDGRGLWVGTERSNCRPRE